MTTSELEPGRGGEAGIEPVPEPDVPLPVSKESSPLRRRMLGAVQKTLPFVIVIAAWESMSRFELVDPFFVPPFTEVAATFIDAVFVSGSMWPHIFASMQRALAGLAAAVVVGVVVGMLMGRIRWVAGFLDPLVAAVFPMPKLAVLPLLILWLGIGDASKITLIFLGALFPILINTYAGVRSVNKYLVWNALTKGAGGRTVVFKVILPAALPHMFSGFRVSSSLAFLLIVASEMVAANLGLGFLIIYSQRMFRPDMMLAGVLMIMILGFIFDRSITRLGEHLLAWEESAGAEH